MDQDQAAREETRAECAGAARSQKVPHAVPDNNRVGHINTESIAGSNKEVRIGLGMLDLISRDHRHMCRVDPYRLQGRGVQLPFDRSSPRPKAPCSQSDT
jgi:hypothetical protein